MAVNKRIIKKIAVVGVVSGGMFVSYCLNRLL